MLSGIKQQGIVGKNGKIEIQASDLAEGTVVEVIILLENSTAEQPKTITQPQDSTESLLSTDANRQPVMSSLQQLDEPQNLVSFTPEEWKADHHPRSPVTWFSWRRCCRFAVLLVLCGSLLGCGLLNPWPPKAIVQQAIAQKLDQTQSLLNTKISGVKATADSFRIGRVNVQSRRSVLLNGKSAVAVAGTYTIKGGNLAWSQRRQPRPFEILIRQGDTQDQWQLVDAPKVMSSSR
jgi:antitoxin YefM